MNPDTPNTWLWKELEKRMSTADFYEFREAYRAQCRAYTNWVRKIENPTSKRGPKPKEPIGAPKARSAGEPGARRADRGS
jgi:hypothetical protein